MYSPKHRHRSMSYHDRSLERSARTPPPTLLFSSQQCQRTIPPEDRKKNPNHPIRLPRQDQKGPVRQPHSVAAVDEPYLSQPDAPVNSNRQEIRKILPEENLARTSTDKEIPFTKTPSRLCSLAPQSQNPAANAGMIARGAS